MTGESITDKRLSRRQFVGTAAAGAAALGAVAGASSLIPHVTAAATSVAATQVPKPASPLKAQPTLPSQWDVTADVVVVGSGAAGFAAAIEAYDAGASVVIIEKETAFFGGNTCMSGGDQQLPANFIQV